MKLLVASDLHLECGEYIPPPHKLFDAVILAGDVCSGVDAVTWASDRSVFGGKPVVLVPGNHEFYFGVRGSTLQAMRLLSSGTQVHVLDRNTYVLRVMGQRIKILGATLWTDFCFPNVKSEIAQAAQQIQNMKRAERGMPDFIGGILEADPTVLGGIRHFKPDDALREHLKSRNWLQEQFSQKTSNICTIVVTHHAPCKLSVATKFERDLLTPCFVSQLPPINFFMLPTLWVHGHVHQSFDYRVQNTRVLANPRGYMSSQRRSENPDFNRDLIIEM